MPQNPPETARPLPYASESEKGLLAAILTQMSGVWEELERVDFKAEHFFLSANQMIFTEMSAMRREGKTVELIGLTDRIARMGLLLTVGGAIYLTELQTLQIISAAWRYHLEAVIMAAAQRCALQEAWKVVDRIYEAETLDGLQIMLNETFSETRMLCRPAMVEVTEKDLLLEYVIDVESRGNGEQLRLLPTTFPSLNRKNGGILEGEVMIISGPESSGKSLLAKDLAMHGCLEYNLPTAIFTAEMSHKQYRDRIVSQWGNISATSLRRGTFSKGELAQFQNALGMMQKVPLYIYDSKRIRMTVSAVERKIRQLAIESGLKIAVIDYLQLIVNDLVNADRRDQELSGFSALLKRLAGEFGLRIFLLAAENDKNTIRDSRGPQFDTDIWISMVVNQKKITDGAYIQKWRDGPRGFLVPLEPFGDIMTITERVNGSHETGDEI